MAMDMAASKKSSSSVQLLDSNYSYHSKSGIVRTPHSKASANNIIIPTDEADYEAFIRNRTVEYLQQVLNAALPITIKYH